MREVKYKKGIRIFEYEKKDFQIPREKRLKKGAFKDIIEEFKELKEKNGI